MNLKILTPKKILMNEEVQRVHAEGECGEFTLLPRQQDYVAALVPSLLTCVTEGKEERLFAIDVGLLVKVGPDVLISVRRALAGTDEGALTQEISEEFEKLDEREKKTQTAMLRLERDFMQQMLEMNNAR